MDERTADSLDEDLVAGQLRGLTGEWGLQMSPALRQQVASMAERAQVVVEGPATSPIAQRPIVRFGVALTAAATLVIAVIPAAQEAVARQLHRVLDVFAIGPNTEVVRRDPATPAETSASLQQFDRELAGGSRWHFATGYGVGVGGRVPPGDSPALRRIDSLNVLQSMTAMPIHYPTVPHRGTVPVFDHAILAPGGALFLFFGSGDDELLLWQASVSSGQGVEHSRVVCCWDEPGKPYSYSPPLKTEELSLDGRTVVWDPDNTGLIPDSSALRWERDGISYSLLGRGLTRDEAAQLFLSLQPWNAQSRHQ